MKPYDLNTSYFLLLQVTKLSPKKVLYLVVDLMSVMELAQSTSI